MNAKHPLMIALLTAFILLFAGGGIGYFVFYQPTQTRQILTAKIERESSEAEQKLAEQKRKLVRLDAIKKRSLPADEMIANREYYDVLYALLQQAKAPAGSTVKPRTVDQKGVPLISQAPKKPAYTRLAYDITMPKADLWAVIRFLKSYYQLNLLQQITLLELRRAEDVTAGGSSFTATDGSDRKDLNVKIVTEAIILDGAESRRSVIPVPTAFAAIGGGAGYHAVAWTPGIGHRITPQSFTPVLATQKRDYFAMIAQDPFHGKLPKPPPPRKVDPAPVFVEPPPPPPPPKPDVSPYIYLVGITIRPEEGSAAVEVRDRMNNSEYEVQFSSRSIEVRRYVGTVGRRQPDPSYKPTSTLQITAPNSSTSREFRIVGVSLDCLYLVDVNERLSSGQGFAALVGGVISVRPPEARTILRWTLGQSLKQITPASPEEIHMLFAKTEVAAR